MNFIHYEHYFSIFIVFMFKCLYETFKKQPLIHQRFIGRNNNEQKTAIGASAIDKNDVSSVI